MKLLPPSDLLGQMQGIEEGLQHNRKAGWLGVLGVLVSAALSPAVRSVIDETNPSPLALVAVGVVALILFFSVAVIIRSRLWLRESREPFSYTCSLGDFAPIGKSSEHAFPQLSGWLGFDLAERLNDRIGRLSFLDEAPRQDPGAPSLSHIHISGQYLARQRADKTWVIEVTPRVWIGGAGSAATLAHPVKYACRDQSAGTATEQEAHAVLVDPDTDTGPDRAGSEAGADRAGSVRLTQSDYEKIVERVYFSVATEIYRRIRQDVKQKISLLPTRYLRATAYFYEAEDYSRSNTLDAFDEARQLYGEAMRLYDRTLVELPRWRFVRRPVQAVLGAKTRATRPLRRLGARVWPRLGKATVMTARAETGYAKALLYRRSLAGMSGHKLNSIYEARPVAERAVSERLERLPDHVPGAQEALVDAYITLALANYQLEFTRKSREYLEKARALEPARCEHDPHFLYVSGVLEARMAAALPLLRQAVERDPRFEVARFEFALRSEMLWRTQPFLEPTYATMVIEEYEAVLKLDPGNVRAWSNLGYMRWLSGDLAEATANYERGCEYTQIQPGAHVASLDWGLARIAAEKGDLARAYHHYLRATSALLAQGVSDSIWTSAQFHFFDFVGPPILNRFERYLEAVLGNTSERDEPDGAMPEDAQVRDSVRAFALTDYGEACHTYYVRSRCLDYREKARENYDDAVRLSPHAFLAHYDLYLLNMYEGHFQAAIHHLDAVRDLEPTWEYGHVAWVAAHAEWAAKKLWEAGLERGSKNGRVALPEEVRAKANTVARDPERLRRLLPHDWLWSDHDFRWEVVCRPRLEKTLRWEKDMDDGHVRALFMWILAHLLLEEEQESVQGFSLANKVRAGGHLEPRAREFLSFIRDHFWPGNLLVLLTARQLLDDETAEEDMRELIERWLITDPTAYWALRMATRDFRGRDSEALSLLPSRTRQEYLERARQLLRRQGNPDSTPLLDWISEQLAAEAKREASPSR